MGFWQSSIKQENVYLSESLKATDMILPKSETEENEKAFHSN